MIAKITQKHIDEGKLQNCEQCPAALALNEMSNTKMYMGSTACWQRNSVIIPLSPELSRWILNFDYSGGPRSTLPKPFEFHISAEAFMR